MLTGNIDQKLPNSLHYRTSRNRTQRVHASFPANLEILNLKDNPLERNSFNQFVINVMNAAENRDLIIQTDENESIKKLPTLVWRLETERRCDICCELFVQGDVIRTLPCIHQYHCRCVDPWLQQHETCPGCRHNINDVGDEQIETVSK